MLIAILIAAIALVAAIVAIVMLSRERALRERIEAASLAHLECVAQELVQVTERHTAQLERLKREASRTQERAPIKLAQDLLPAIDALEQARNQTTDALFVQGLDMAIGELERALARHQITPLRPAPDADFDPAIHEAVHVEAAPEGVRAGHVIACLRSGWTHPTGNLRPAMVRAAARQAAPAASAPSPLPQRGDEEVVFAHEDAAAEEQVILDTSDAAVRDEAAQAEQSVGASLKR